MNYKQEELISNIKKLILNNDLTYGEALDALECIREELLNDRKEKANKLKI